MDLERMRKAVECPICLNVPPSRVYSCKSGHLICEGCFVMLPVHEKICPTGRCRFDNPPQRNFVVENIIETSDLTVKCDQCNDRFVGSPDSIYNHEKKLCRKRRIHCVLDTCGEKIYISDVVKHLKRHDRHRNIIFPEPSAESRSSSKSPLSQKWLMKSVEHLNKEQSDWNFVVTHFDKHYFGIRFLKRNRVWYSWVQLLGEEKDAENYWCEISTHDGKRIESKITWTGKVYSAEQTVDTIIASRKNLKLDADQMEIYWSSDDISANSRDANFDRQLSLSYTIHKKAGAVSASASSASSDIRTTSSTSSGSSSRRERSHQIPASSRGYTGRVSVTASRLVAGMAGNVGRRETRGGVDDADNFRDSRYFSDPRLP